MKKIAFVLVMLSMLLASCSNKDSKVEGTFGTSKFDGQQVFLQLVGDIFEGKMQPIDSAVVKDGKFELGAKSGEKPQLAFVSLGKLSPDREADQSYVTTTSVIIEKGTITLTFSEDKAAMSGTPLNDQFQQLQVSMIELGELQETAGELSEADEDALLTQIKAKYEDVQKVSFDLVKNNMTNNVGESLFPTAFQTFTTEQLTELLALATDEYKKKPQIAQLVNMLEMDAKRTTQFLGQDIADVKIYDMKGKEMSLKNSVPKGKYVLIDFWASWCGPCIQEMPKLKELHAKYKDAGFDILGVSVDQDEASWKEAIGALGLTWAQALDKHTFAATQYGISTIPFTLLVDKEGKIIAAGLRGDKLEAKIGELLNK